MIPLRTRIPFTIRSCAITRGTRSFLPFSSLGLGDRYGRFRMRRCVSQLSPSAKRIPFPRCCCRAVVHRSRFQTPLVSSTKGGGVTAVYQQFSLRPVRFRPISNGMLMTPLSRFQHQVIFQRTVFFNAAKERT